MDKINIHYGSYESIPATASPGLLYLKHFLPALDSLDPISHPISPFLHPKATVLVGSNPPSTGEQVTTLLEVRNRHLSRFHHDVHTAWDLERKDDGAVKRTVMFEATSGTVFQTDPDQFEVKVEEFNVIELQKKSEVEGEQLQAVAMRTYMDPRPVQDQAARLQRESAYGQARLVK